MQALPIVEPLDEPDDLPASLGSSGEYAVVHQLGVTSTEVVYDLVF